MKKIEIFSSGSAENLKDDVNQFMATHDVTDIQFKVSAGDYRLPTYAVMVIYEE